MLDAAGDDEQVMETQRMLQLVMSQVNCLEVTISRRTRQHSLVLRSPCDDIGMWTVVVRDVHCN